MQMFVSIGLSVLSYFGHFISYTFYSSHTVDLMDLIGNLVFI